MDTQLLEQVRDFFAKDKFATDNGAVIEEFREGYSRCSIEIDERHLNAVGGVQGGVHYMLSDFAFAVATNWKECKTVSLHSDIAYLGTLKGKKMIAEANCVKNGRSTCYYRIDVKDELGNMLAVTNITGFHK
ncbi:MAG: PaaI family thioesterase [Lachnospiraceae bacterium]|nr:PaaI family thioesterase [Lachnospiraceae bacterium]